MTNPSRRTISRFGLALVLLVPLGLSVWWFSTRSAPVTTRFDEALDRALVPVMEQREVQHKLGTSTSNQARMLARELARRSVPYVAAHDLELWAEVRDKVARASPAACAKLWKGGDDTFLGPAIAELGDAELESYVAMLARGFALRLERKPPPSIAAGSIERGFAAAAEALPAEARAAFEKDVKRADVGDTRACELFLQLSRGAQKMEPAARSDFYRALAVSLTPPELRAR
ncbi:MAG TPA: hypothetical protein VHB79_22495 [Polyangiaceae bacterium]|nr:hypothetical protein [Polyangiaceae bacterium]